MQFHAIGRTAADQHSLVTTQQLLNVGVSEGQIRRLARDGFLVPKHRGVYVVGGSEPSWEQDVHAVVLAVSGSVVSHITAARLWGFTTWDCGEIQISTPPSHDCKLEGVRAYQTDTLPRPVPNVNGIPLTSVAKTLFDVGDRVSPSTLEKYVETALAKRLTSFDVLRRQLRRDGKQGRNGAGALRALLDRYDPEDEKATTKLQRDVLRALRDVGLPAPEQEFHIVVDGRNRFLDFAWPELKLGIEAHSREWHQLLLKFESDWDRRDGLQELDWKVVHVTHRLMEKGINRVFREYHRRIAAFSTAFVGPDTTNAVENDT